MKQVYTNSNKGVDITAGKYYDYQPSGSVEHGYIEDDRGNHIFIRLKSCHHLLMDDWILVEK